LHSISPVLFVETKAFCSEESSPGFAWKGPFFLKHIFRLYVVKTEMKATFGTLEFSAAISYVQSKADNTNS